MSTVRFDPEILKKSPGNAGPGGNPAGGAGMPGMVSPLPPERYYFFIGLGVGICAGVITCVVRWPEDWNIIGIFQAIVRAIGTGGFAGGLTGLLFAVTATIKDWLYQFADWKRLRDWANEDRKRAIEGEQIKTIELSSGFRLDYVAMVIMSIAWIQNGEYTREKISAAQDKLDGVYLVCTPTEWNDVMGVMTSVGLRISQKLKTQDYTFEQAVALWRSKVTPEKDGLRVGATLIGKSSVISKGRAKGGKKK